jgi:hypothetical protein
VPRRSHVPEFTGPRGTVAAPSAAEGQEDFISPHGWVECVGRDGRRVVAPLLSSSMSTLTQLPEELLQRILLSSEAADLAAAAVTCTALAGAARSNDLWHTLFQRDYALWFDRGGGNAAGPRDADDWRARWQQSHRLGAVDCLQWRSPPVSWRGKPLRRSLRGGAGWIQTAAAGRVHVRLAGDGAARLTVCGCPQPGIHLLFSFRARVDGCGRAGARQGW